MSFFKDSMLQWPIQMLEQQLQFIASSKVDYVGATSSLITDIDFRWLGIRNLKTIQNASKFESIAKRPKEYKIEKKAQNY